DTIQQISLQNNFINKNNLSKKYSDNIDLSSLFNENNDGIKLLEDSLPTPKLSSNNSILDNNTLNQNKSKPSLFNFISNKSDNNNNNNNYISEKFNRINY